LIALTGRASLRTAAASWRSLARRRPSSVHADRVRVGTGLPAQARSLAGERFIVPPLGRALEDPGHLGEQISPAPGKRAELSNRGGFLAAGQVAPSSPVPRLARQLGDEDTISFRALIHQDPDAPIETELVDLSEMTVAAWGHQDQAQAEPRTSAGSVIRR
jgi:hypothetical protein